MALKEIDKKAAEKGKGMETFVELGSITLPILDMRAEINEQNNYLFEHYVINFPAGKLAGRQIALIDRCQDATVIHIDNAKLDAAEEYSTPLMSSIPPQILVRYISPICMMALILGIDVYNYYFPEILG